MINTIIQNIEAFGTGLIVGVVFSLLHLPIPAPGVLAGVMGIIGIFTGYVLIKAIIK